MRFLVDESSGERLARLLRQDGHDVVYAGDMLERAEDATVLEHADREKRILVTDDKDFGELIWRLGKPAFGILLLRFETKRAETRIALLRDAFAGRTLEGKFTVVNEYSVRQREL